MKHVKAREYTGSRPWEALPLVTIDGVTTRLHWTNAPYRWHMNDGLELFTVLDGVVDMHYRVNGTERVIRLEAGDSFVAEAGEEHSAHPDGEARILVVERAGSD